MKMLRSGALLLFIGALFAAVFSVSMVGVPQAQVMTTSSPAPGEETASPAPPSPAEPSMPAATPMPAAPGSNDNIAPGRENGNDMLHNNPNGGGWLDKFNRNPGPDVSGTSVRSNAHAIMQTRTNANMTHTHVNVHTNTRVTTPAGTVRTHMQMNSNVKVKTTPHP